MKVLVTGGAGYIGSHTCKDLAQKGHDVIVYDNLSTGFEEFVKWGALEFGDILDADRLRAVFRKHKPEGVIHFAAKSVVGESISNPGLYVRNNVLGTLNILEVMKSEGIQHIVVSGTCAVYGEPESLPIKENIPTKPINPYGESKLFMEQMLHAFSVAHGISWISLRYFNAAGCDPDLEIGEQHTPETHLIPKTLLAAMHKIPMLSIFGDDYPTEDGTCIRDYIHVCDLADAHSRALAYLCDGGCSDVLNLGIGHGFSVKEIIKTASKVIGKDIPYTVEKRRPGDPPQLIADPSKAYKQLGWNPKYKDITYIISTAWDWYTKIYTVHT